MTHDEKVKLAQASRSTGGLGARSVMEAEFLVAKQEEREFNRSAFLDLADEFDPHGATSTPTLDEFEPVYVEAARAFAKEHDLPFPYLQGIDEALRAVERAEHREG